MSAHDDDWEGEPRRRRFGDRLADEGLDELEDFDPDDEDDEPDGEDDEWDDGLLDDEDAFPEDEEEY